MPSTPKEVGAGWKTTLIRVGTQTFYTTMEAVTQFENTLLTELFSPPFPIYDQTQDVHVLPPALVDAETFAVILDFLRCGTWQPMRSDRQHQVVCAALA